MLAAALALLLVTMTAALLTPAHAVSSHAELQSGPGHHFPLSSTTTTLHGGSAPPTTGPSASQTFSAAASAAPSEATQAPNTPSRAIDTVSPQVSSERIETGWLQGPTSISATYQATLSASTTLSATFQGTTALTLSATCGGVTNSTSGLSPLSLSEGPGTCSVTLSGPSDLAATTFSLDLGAQ